MTITKKHIYIASTVAIVLLFFSYGLGFYSRDDRQTSMGQAFVGLFSNRNYEENKNVTVEAVPKIDESKAEEQFYDVLEYVKENFVETEVDTTNLYYGAMAGAVASLKDPYSVFLEPEISEQFHEELSGRFEGIGAEIGIREQRLTVIAPLTDSPAQRAGLLARDVIFAIDGKDTDGMSLEYAVNLIRGEKGSEVTLTVFHEKADKLTDVAIVRDTINIVSVEWRYEGAKSDGIAYIQLKYFNHDTLERFRKIAKDIMKQNPKGIVLDLRNNPGGLLHTAVEVTSFWIGNSEVAVLEKSRNEKLIGHKAQNRNAQLGTVPTVVLINQGSASGSEIVAGALQDFKKAVLIGETSFGKGSVQDLREFSDGSSVKLTIAKWLTPAGREIDAEGVVPDIEVEMTQEDFEAGDDPQLQRALEYLKVGE